MVLRKRSSHKESYMLNSKLMKYFILSLSMLSFALSSCSNASNKNNNQIPENEDSNPNADYYISIIEIILTEEETKKEKQYEHNDFGNNVFRYVANSVYQNIDNGRKTLVAVLKNNSMINAREAISIVKQKKEVYDANLVPIPSEDGRLLDYSFMKIFDDSKPTTASTYGIHLGLYKKKTPDGMDYHYSEKDFPEINVSSFWVYDYENIGLYYSTVNLVDNSVEGTLNSFLSLRHNKNLRYVEYPSIGFGD